MVKNSDLSESRKKLSRRSFIKGTLAGTAISGALGQQIYANSQRQPQRQNTRTLMPEEFILSEDAKGVDVIVVGSGTPDVDPYNVRAGTSEIIRIGGEAILIDVGMWVCERIMRCSIKPWSIHQVFITHSFHYDHFADLPAFLFTRGLNTGREIDIYGPVKTERRVDAMIRQVYDGDMRAQNLIARDVLKVHDISPGPIYKGKTWEITCVSVPHSDEAVGFRIETEEGSIGITGDLQMGRREQGRAREGFIENDYKVFEFFKNVDLLIIDADALHNPAKMVGQAIKEIDPKRVLLTHFHNLNWKRTGPIDYSDLVNTVKEHFSGEVIQAEPLKEISL